AAADGEHLLLAARQRAGALRTAFEQPWEDRKHALAILRAARAGAPVAAEIEILAHREIGEDAPALRHMNKSARDDCGRLLAADVDTIEPDRAARGAQDTRKSAVERRFADAIRAEHGNDLARIDRK